MLWIPLGQHDFLFEHWMKVGVFMAPFLAFLSTAKVDDSAEEFRFDLSLVSLTLLIAYIFHQFEEHWIDLFGNRYAFKPYVNQLLVERLGVENEVEGPLTDAGVFVINTSLVWLVAFLAIWRGPRHNFPVFCLASIVVINALSHIAVGILASEYNPGLLTSIVLFLPLGLAAYLWTFRSASGNAREVLASILWGVLGHIIMIAGMIASGVYGIFPEVVYFCLLVAWSVLPVSLYRKRTA
ncbi:MAG: HXXEE domain-containing protein [Verrucomicrobiota bacterium]